MRIVYFFMEGWREFLYLVVSVIIMWVIILDLLSFEDYILYMKCIFVCEFYGEGVRFCVEVFDLGCRVEEKGWYIWG